MSIRIFIQHTDSEVSVLSFKNLVTGYNRAAPRDYLDLFAAYDGGVHLEYSRANGPRRRQCGQTDVDGVGTLRVKQGQLPLRTVRLLETNHRHGIDKYLDTLLTCRS